MGFHFLSLLCFSSFPFGIIVQTIGHNGLII
uniref:Uncharacterized protein n=1 Tax=Rhizophora mucronata TaxID=61149 RepID=A0A2P2NXG1_RHIMU